MLCLFTRSVKITHLSCNRLYFKAMHTEEVQQQESQVLGEGRWDELEHQKFLHAITAYGKNWKMIEEVVETRTTAQVRSHAQKFFLKLNKVEKERKKNLKKGITEPSKNDLDLTKSLLEQTVTPQTPTQILLFLRREAHGAAAKTKDQPKLQTSNSNIKPPPRKSPIIQDLLEGNEEESFLVSLIRQTKGFSDPEQALNDMIDFPEIHRQQKEEEETTNKRKKSFSFYEQEQDDERHQMLRKMQKQ